MELTQVGPYRLGQRLGHGGMGAVYRAQDESGRVVAVKVLHPHIALDRSSRERLEREVDTLGRVRHPHVASFLDADIEGPHPYIVTEFVPGMPLDDHVATHGPLRGEELDRFVAGAGEALEAIHATGVVHRDLKPGNVMVDPELGPVIIDFGIAHIGDESRLTATGLVMGTPGYLAPELIEGGQPTRATDWWGLGAVTAYAATGRNPYGGGASEVVLMRIRQGQHDLRAVPERWQPLVEACLAVEPSARPAAAVVREVAAQGGGDLPEPERRRTAALPEATRPLPVRGSAPGDATVPVAEATQPVRRDSTRRISRRALSQGEAPPVEAGLLTPPPQHRENPAGTLRPPEEPSTRDIPPERREYRPAVPAQPPGPPRPSAPTGPHGPVPRQHVGPPPPSARDERAARRAAREHAASLRLHPYDPRTRLRRHPWVVASGVLLLVVAATWAPLGVLLVAAGWSILARWVDHAALAHLRRLQSWGRRRGDGWRIGLLSPWHLLTAVLRAVLGWIAPVVLGAATVVGVNLVLGQDLLLQARGDGGGVDSALALGAGALVLLVALWIGIDCAGLRRGTHLSLSVSLRTSWAGPVLVLLNLAVAAALLFSQLQRDFPDVLWPLA
ncbi:Serine/threonine protein kinase [Kytococcus aerolatus]|uniref:Serine/threonine protein kinase n=1 Tax=Kytococcus aerolatus TaxID=592308 RepID=A0A212U5X7_9MICO|nr:serine/threonine-protein kinase [Kytococcus aerolatus]SNC73596.1 Serine/threonine protein kinase [Kytococcus aerolatus]